MKTIDDNLLKTIADLDGIPMTGAFNVRKNGISIARSSSPNVKIQPKTDKPGIDIIVKPGVKETVHIPVIVTQDGLSDMVYNDFYIGEGSDVEIVAGCGIHNDGDHKCEHHGIHRFVIGKNAKVRYAEKHYGEGEGTGERVLNPETVVEMEEGSSAVFEMVQIRGVDSTMRKTTAKMAAGSHMDMIEKLLTHGKQKAYSDVEITLEGEDATVAVVSRSVAQESSEQVFYPRVIGKAACRAHVQCDSIIMDQAQVRSIPEIAAYHPDAQLVHEAAIGKIAGDQILKLMTLGLTEQQAEERILQSFLK